MLWVGTFSIMSARISELCAQLVVLETGHVQGHFVIGHVAAHHVLGDDVQAVAARRRAESLF